MRDAAEDIGRIPFAAPCSSGGKAPHLGCSTPEFNTLGAVWPLSRWRGPLAAGARWRHQCQADIDAERRSRNVSRKELVRASFYRPPAYLNALCRGWSPDNLRPEAVREELEAILNDPGRFVGTFDDPGAAVEPAVRRGPFSGLGSGRSGRRSQRKTLIGNQHQSTIRSTCGRPLRERWPTTPQEAQDDHPRGNREDGQGSGRELPRIWPDGLVESPIRMAGLDWPVRDFSTLCRRQARIGVQIPYRRTGKP